MASDTSAGSPATYTHKATDFPAQLVQYMTHDDVAARGLIGTIHNHPLQPLDLRRKKPGLGGFPAREDALQHSNRLPPLAPARRCGAGGNTCPPLASARRCGSGGNQTPI